MASCARTSIDCAAPETMAEAKLSNGQIRITFGNGNAMTVSGTLAFYAVGDVPYTEMEACILMHELIKLSAAEREFVQIQPGHRSAPT